MNLSALSLSAAVAQTKSTPLSSVSKPADDVEMKDPETPPCTVAKLADDIEMEDPETPPCTVSKLAGDIENEDDEEEDEEEEESRDEEDEEEEAEEAEEEEAEKMADADLIEMKTLRSTTSTHDDWLHRGPYLHDIAFHTYVEYIDRVRLPRQAPAEQQIFRFEPHYAMSQSYCQRIRTPARLPVLEALKFQPPGETTKEENALYKHIVGSLLRCTCAGSCSDPLLFKPLLGRSGSVAKPAKWCWTFTWKARRAELEVLATRGEEKTARARRVPCIHDTTVTRGWLPDAASTCSQGKAPPPLLLRATLAQYSCARFGMIFPDEFAPLLQLSGIANTNPDQLTLAEFTALRTRRLVQNLDMMAIARTVQLGAKSKGADAEHEDDDEKDPRKVASAVQSEFVGGEHDIDEEAEIHDEHQELKAPHSQARS